MSYVRWPFVGKRGDLLLLQLARRNALRESRRSAPSFERDSRIRARPLSRLTGDAFRGRESVVRVTADLETFSKWSRGPPGCRTRTRRFTVCARTAGTSAPRSTDIPRSQTPELPNERARSGRPGRRDRTAGGRGRAEGSSNEMRRGRTGRLRFRRGALERHAKTRRGHSAGGLHRYEDDAPPRLEEPAVGLSVEVVDRIRKARVPRGRERKRVRPGGFDPETALQRGASTSSKRPALVPRSSGESGRRSGCRPLRAQRARGGALRRSPSDDNDSIPPTRGRRARRRARLGSLSRNGAGSPC